MYMYILMFIYTYIYVYIVARCPRARCLLARGLAQLKKSYKKKRVSCHYRATTCLMRLELKKKKEKAKSVSHGLI